LERLARPARRAGRALAGLSPWQKAGLVYLAALALVLYGYLGHKHSWFPFHALQKAKHYLLGPPDGMAETVVQRLLNDLGFMPYRLMLSHQTSQERDYTEHTVPGARQRRERGLLVHRAAGAHDGYLAVCGTFDFQEGLHGVLLLDSRGRPVHRWVVSERGLSGAGGQGEENQFPHGLAVLPDGSIIVSFDNGSSLQRLDWCGNRLWVRRGEYHHSISLDGRGALWVLGPGPNLLSKISVANGETLATVDLLEVMEANPGIDILGLRQYDFQSGYQWFDDAGGRWHANDADPLRPEMAGSFPGFEAGDLLVCLRSLNLLFVLDPETLRIKWWRMGEWRRPHDPDWSPDGAIVTYDNNMHRGFSRITKLWPGSLRREVLYEGREEDFYSWQRGKQQVLPGSNLLITVPMQGRVLEVTDRGEVVFELVNAYRRENHAKLALSEAVHLPRGYFEFPRLPSCP
jgi:hypothetical protein